MFQRVRILILICTVLMANYLVVKQAFSQGQDGTIAERNIMIMAELLPGLYNNANQSYFDARLRRPDAEQHAFTSLDVQRLSDEALGRYAFSVEFKSGDAAPVNFVYTLELHDEHDAVRMKTFQRDKSGSPVYLQNCDLAWRQHSGQFESEPASELCSLSNKEVDGYQAELSESAFWLRLPERSIGFIEMDQARNFNCYVDVPGVGGGRDIPYERVELNDIHDLGGEKWFTTKDGQEIGVNLFRVMWPMNNYDGIFTRPSLVIYAKTKEEATVVEKGYAWTSPDAQRIGINLKWMLANCYLISNADVTPFFKTNEPLR